MIFDKGVKITQWRKGRPFNKWCCKNYTCTCKRMKPTPYTNIDSKWIKHKHEV